MMSGRFLWSDGGGDNFSGNFRSQKKMNGHQTISQVIELFGVVMQLAILVLLLVRRQGLRFPAFSLMLLFFLLRSGLIYFVSNYAARFPSITQLMWSHVGLGLSIAEDALQAAIVIELWCWLLPALRAWRLRVWWKLAVGAAIAGGFLWVMLQELGYWPTAEMMQRVSKPTLVLLNTHIGLVALTTELLLLAALAVVALGAPDSPETDVTPVRLLAAKFALGWGVFASVNLIGLAVGHYAARTRDAALSEHMQYTVIGAYVLMMVLWLVSIIQFSPKKAETKAS
jgi:hypothetical protein